MTVLKKGRICVTVCLCALPDTTHTCHARTAPGNPLGSQLDQEERKLAKYDRQHRELNRRAVRETAEAAGDGSAGADVV